MSWKAIDRYSQDYIELQTKDKVKFYKTPDAILQKQLERVRQGHGEEAAENPLFKEMIESQKAFAERAVTMGHRYIRRVGDGVQPLFRRQPAAPKKA